jgi:hypothetical protein
MFGIQQSHNKRVTTGMHHLATVGSIGIHNSMLNSTTSKDAVKIKTKSKETKPALKALKVNCEQSRHVQEKTSSPGMTTFITIVSSETMETQRDGSTSNYSPGLRREFPTNMADPGLVLNDNPLI